MTTVYILRHSKPLRNNLGEYNSSELEQIRNEKNPLCVEGEKLALEMSLNKELQDIDVLYSSHYVRAMSTAKYISERNNILLNVDSRFGERKFGVNSMSELPKSFFNDQFNDWNYKIGNGECLNEVSKRMQEALFEVINNNKDKRICIVSHGTALTAMLSKWCELKYSSSNDKAEIHFNNNMVFDGNWNAPELFKLEFDNDNLVSIKNIR